MNTFSEEDVQSHLFAVGLGSVLEDDEVRLEEVIPRSSGSLSELEIPEFELWKLLKERALEKLRYLHDLTREGEFIGAGINLPIDKTRHMRWSRPFGQFCGLDKLYPVVVMPPF